MVEFINVVDGLDKITDCVPVVSTVKNVGFLLYQLIHKVDTVANPVKRSWKNDLKIHALSKNHSMIGIASIPFIGNVYCAGTYLGELLSNLLFGRSTGYLEDSSRKGSFRANKHSYEITKLYFAGGRKIPEDELKEVLISADRGQKEGLFELILKDMNLSLSVLKDLLKRVQSKENAKLLLEKCNGELTDADAGEILFGKSVLYNESKYPIIEFLVDNFPGIDIDSVGHAIVELTRYKDSYKAIELLLKKSSNLHKKDLNKAIENSAHEKNQNFIELIDEYYPGILEANLDEVLKIIARKHDLSILKWLLDKCKASVTYDHIGVVLEAQTSTKPFSKDSEELAIINHILSAYPDLPPESLVPFMRSAAAYASRNSYLFVSFLDKFTQSDSRPQLKPEHLQDLLNDAVFVLGVGDTSISEGWKLVGKSIQNKFPDMQAVDPYSAR